MDKNKIKKYLEIILAIVYILSVIYFIKLKNIGNIGISIGCLIGTIIIYFISKKLDKLINNNLYIIFSLFILFSSLLGSCYRLYDKINHYDDFLHIWSGFISISVAYRLLNFFNKSEVVNNMSKIFVTIYLFMFSMGVASLWEIMEFSLDVFLGMNTQAGGLIDTMIDMMDALVGSIIMISIIIRKIKNKYKEIA